MVGTGCSGHKAAGGGKSQGHASQAKTELKENLHSIEEVCPRVLKYIIEQKRVRRRKRTRRLKAHASRTQYKQYKRCTKWAM